MRFFRSGLERIARMFAFAHWDVAFIPVNAQSWTIPVDNVNPVTMEDIPSSARIFYGSDGTQWYTVCTTQSIVDGSASEEGIPFVYASWRPEPITLQSPAQGQTITNFIFAGYSDVMAMTRLLWVVDAEDLTSQEAMSIPVNGTRLTLPHTTDGEDITVVFGNRGALTLRANMPTP